jgi:hypothetical protein
LAFYSHFFHAAILPSIYPSQDLDCGTSRSQHPKRTNGGCLPPIENLSPKEFTAKQRFTFSAQRALWAGISCATKTKPAFALIKKLTFPLLSHTHNALKSASPRAKKTHQQIKQNH